MKKLYADFELNSVTDDMFVIVPETGNYFNFPGENYNEKSKPKTIIDPKNHEEYLVVFDE